MCRLQTVCKITKGHRGECFDNFLKNHIYTEVAVQLFRIIQAVGYLDRVANRGEYLDNFSKNHVQGWTFGQLFIEPSWIGYFDNFSEQQMGLLYSI